MSNDHLNPIDWRRTFAHCNDVKASLVAKIGVPGKAVTVRMAALHATLISYHTGIRTQELLEGMFELVV